MSQVGALQLCINELTSHLLPDGGSGSPAKGKAKLTKAQQAARANLITNCLDQKALNDIGKALLKLLAESEKRINAREGLLRLPSKRETHATDASSLD